MKKDAVLVRRVYILVAVMGLWGMVIGARLYFLQVVRSAYYHERADKQQQQGLDVMPPRGIIYDRNGSELAASIKVKSVFAMTQEIEDVAAAAKTLSGITGEPVDDLVRKLDVEKRFVWIKRKVSNAEASAIERADIPGIHFQEESQRSYPNGELAAHVLGFVGTDQDGLAGLEVKYDQSVRGESGHVVYISDGRRKSYGQVEQPALPGANLITTIDKNIQYFVEQEMRDAEERTHARNISIIVMDPNTGQILAMANYPTYNPNSFRNFSPETLQNGAVVHTYEPGSTFKILTVGAALEENLTTPEEPIDCLLGSIVVAGQRIHDHKPFGVLTVSEILENSSDVGAITLGLRLKDDRMSKYIKLYGFGRQTGIDLPGEERGITRPISQWRKSSIGYISMGQEIGVTPLQIVSMVSMVANGGTLYRPYVVKEVQTPEVSRTEPSGQRVMSQKSAEQMQSMLEKVVTQGTAKTAKLDGFRAAGKTGTAQKIDSTGKYSATKLIASFAGFAPVSKPTIAMVVVVDEPVGAHHGGEVAAPIFKNIADKVLRYQGLAPDVEGYAPPRYTGNPGKHQSAPPSVAKPTPGELTIVKANFANPATTADSHQVGDVTVPDFQGKTKIQIYDDCRKLGLVLSPEGSGRAVRQSPQAGAQVRLGATVQVQFLTK